MQQWALSVAIAAMLSGAMAERTKPSAHLLFTGLLVSLVYPFVACGIWNGEGCFSSRRSSDLLFGCGVLDTAGS